MRLGMRSEEDCAVLEEHLLMCAACQDLLAEADDYIQVVKAAAAAFLTGQNGEGDTPVTDSQTRRRIVEAGGSGVLTHLIAAVSTRKPGDAGARL